MSLPNPAALGAPLPAAGGDPSSVIASLQSELALEKAKNDVLMQQILAVEDSQAAGDLNHFSDVIPNEDRDAWRVRLLENRCGAVSELQRLRKRSKLPNAVAPAADPAPDPAPDPAAVPPASPGAPPASAPRRLPPARPLHNREAARAPVASAFGAPPSGATVAADRAAKLRNRAQEISRKEGVSFSAAFRRAEGEFLA